MSEQREAIRGIIREMLRVTGLTLTELAREAGVSPSTVTRFFNQPVKYNLSTTTLGKLSGASGVTVPGVVPVLPETDEREIAALPLSNVRPAPDAQTPTAPSRLPLDLRVLGSAQGGKDGAFELGEGSHMPVDIVLRPAGLIGAAEAFALYTVGDSMEPWRFEGELIYVHPGRPTPVGSFVVVVLHPTKEGEGRRALVKRLVARRNGKTILKQYNPPKEIEIPTANIEVLWHVVVWQEAVGVR